MAKVRSVNPAGWMAGAIVVALFSTFPGQAAARQGEGGVQFRVKMLTLDQNEGCAIADLNNDGQLDIVAGRNWYAGPEFVPRPLRMIEDWNGYVQSNGDHVWDVNGDGWVDVIAGSYIPTEVHWYENPGSEGLAKGQLWQQHLLGDTGATNNEGQFLHDLDMDGDGVPEWVVNSWSKNVPLLAWKMEQDSEGRPAMRKIVVGQQNNGHGMGFGDINGDGREDVFIETGWYERPAQNALSQPWTYHDDWDIHASLPVIIRDLDDDGRNDIIVGKGHDYGLYWWRQLEPAPDGSTRWEKHTIDESWSQPHALHMADLDGDGDDELITGKRVWAHNGNDPGGNEPPCLYYYTWDGDSRQWTRDTIDEGRVGTGLQVRTADLNGDGRVDIAVAGKSGTYVLFNEGD